MTQTPSTRRPPGAFARRILLMVTGRTPQVVTETLYALAVGQDPPPTDSPLHQTASRSLGRVFSDRACA